MPDRQCYPKVILQKKKKMKLKKNPPNFVSQFATVTKKCTFS